MKTGFSSGDLVVDRRADYALALANDGELGPACDLMADALTLAPGWAAGWFRLGEFHEKAGRRDQAADAFRRVLAVDGGDPLGAALKLELLGGEKASMPPAFVESLFDQYADGFESALLGKLDYRAPTLLSAALEAANALPAARALDLGCGTGLMGEKLRPRVAWLEGVDLSAKMLAKASAKGVYDRLLHADLALGKFGGAFDLAVAADVFMYVGGLDGVFAATRAALFEGGWFAFSVESLSDRSGFQLRESRRYAHGEGYIRDDLNRAGFRVASLESATIRLDRGHPVEGLIVVARRL